VIEIKEGAVFVADIHENENRKVLRTFLEDIKSLNPPQLFLMGDIFDFLTYPAKFTLKFYQKEIEAINLLSESLEIYYLEGNHDFNLGEIFPKVKVFPLSNQPVKARYKNEQGFLAHGDVFSGFKYNLFHFFLRSRYLLGFLNFIAGRKLPLYYLQKTQNKKICKKIPNFNKIIKQKIDLYDIGLSKVGFIIEGHYHQGLVLEEKCLYFNLKSYGCDKKYYQIRGDKITLI